MRRAPAALLFASGALLAGSIFFSGGSRDEPIAWIGGAALVVAAALCLAVLRGLLPLPDPGRPGLLFVALLGAFVAWSGVTIAWSAAPDRSWDYFNRGVVYFVFALLGLMVGAVVPRAPRLVALGLAVLIGAACFWALAGKVVPALYDDYGRFARLRSPVGYWNGLAVLGAVGLPLGLWIASVREHARWLRAAGVLVLYLVALAIPLTYSRGGLLAAIFAVVAYLVLARARVEGIVAGAIALACAVPALAWGLTQPGVADDFQSRATRVDDGAWFGLIAFLGALAALALAWAAAPRRVSDRPGRLVVRGALAAAIVVGLVGAISVVRGGGGDVVSQSPGRLASAGSNNRTGWWDEAWQAYRGEPAIGIGAGSFELVHRKLRHRKIEVTEPHNLVLQFAAETGTIGLLLFGGSMGAALLGLWRRRADEVALAVGLALPTYLLHGLLDYDWDFLAITGPVLFATGVVLAAGGPERRLGAQPVWALVAVLVSGAFLFSIVAPRLAAHRVDQAYAALDDDEFEAAVSHAKDARSLNPLALDPVHAEASSEEARGRLSRAYELYVEAVEVQPLNWEAWYQLGCFELEALADYDKARLHLGRALELDPLGPAARAVIVPGIPGQQQPPRAQC